MAEDIFTLAYPAGQDDPQVIGEVGGPNLRSLFTVTNDVVIDGDDFTTLSLPAKAYMVAQPPYSLAQKRWLIQ